MALKAKLLQTVYDTLPDLIKKEYIQEGDDFVLQIEGGEDVGALKRAKDHEANKRKVIEKDLNEAKAKITELETQLEQETQRKGSETATLEQRHKTEKETLINKHKEEKVKLENQLAAILVHDQANALANELCGDNAEIILPHIEKRLKADLTGDKAATLVLAEDGTDSGSTLEDLKKEILANKKFSAIVIASKASGSGARPGNGGAVPQTKKFAEMSDAERKAFHTNDPAGFDAAVKEQQKQQRGY